MPHEVHGKFSEARRRPVFLAGDFEKASRLMFEIRTGFYQLKVNKLFIALARALGF